MQKSNSKLMKNGVITEPDALVIPTGSGLVYEVIRIIGGTPLFFEEHYARLVNSAKTRHGQSVPSDQTFRQMTDGFLNTQTVLDYNIKILFEPDTGDLYILDSPSAYPAEALYQKGIHTELMPYMRQDPNSKITNNELAELANQLKKVSGAYEVLLVDETGFITEGSKSNLFFILDDTLITPPLESVLPGVTRQKIIDMAKNININVIETNIKADELHKYKGAFMSGTSPKILPIESIGSINMDSAKLPLILALMQEFAATIQTDLESYRKTN